MLKIKELRTLKRMTLDQLAEASGISKRMISAYEAQENDITLGKLQNIATALDVSISQLIDETPTSPNNSVCTNEKCLSKIERLEKYIEDLIDDKRRLKESIDSLQEGGSMPGKRVEGGVGKSSKKEAV